MMPKQNSSLNRLPLNFGFGVLVAVPLSVGLVACGETRAERVLSGAGIGAATGAVGTTITGGNPLPGAIVGGVVGGAAGGLTDQNDLDLGDPIWERR